MNEILTVPARAAIRWRSLAERYALVVLVIALTGMHHAFGKWRKDFAADRNRHDQRFYRIVNEVPTLLLIGIVILVVVKPF